MCLILFAYNRHPLYRLVLAANRDEFYDRPTAEAHFWKERPDILAGKDLKEGGAWLGVSRNGRFAAVTNYRDPSLRKDQAISRGFLVSDYLLTETETEQYIEQIKSRIISYNDFNLLLGDSRNIYHLSSQPLSSKILADGLYGLSNHLLNTPWPKTKSGMNALNEAISDPGGLSIEALLSILADTSQPGDSLLPETGVGLEWERILAPIFIKSPAYGTRSSTVLLIDNSGGVTLVERTYDPYDSRNITDRRFEIRSAGYD